MRPNATEMCKEISFMTALYTQQAFPRLANREQSNFHVLCIKDEGERKKKSMRRQRCRAWIRHRRVNDDDDTRTRNYPARVLFVRVNYYFFFFLFMEGIDCTRWGAPHRVIVMMIDLGEGWYPAKFGSDCFLFWLIRFKRAGGWR